MLFTGGGGNGYGGGGGWSGGSGKKKTIYLKNATFKWIRKSFIYLTKTM